VSAVERTGPPCIVDLAPRWTIDAALFLTLSAALLVWSIALTSARAAGVTVAIAAGAALLADRFAPSLTHPATIAEQSLEQPIGAYHQSMARYLVTAVAVIAVFAAVTFGVGFLLGSSTDGIAPLAACAPPDPAASD
jgi:hypothetical protein